MRSQTLITVGIATFSLGLISASIGNRLTTPSADAGIGSGPVPTDTRQEPVTIPQIVSSVPGIEVVSVELVESRKPVDLAVHLRNNTDQDVTYLYLESSTCRDGSASGTGGPFGKPIIPAHETIRHLVGLSNHIPGAPIRIAAVRYADGAVVGENEAKQEILRFF